MRRRAPSMPVSPDLLKHFAAATVAITCLLALFAGGDEIGMATQIDAQQARNQLVAAEQEKLGTKKVSNSLKVSKQASGSFGPEESDESVNNGFGSGSAGSGPPRRVNGPQAPMEAYAPAAKMPGNPGESVTFTGVPGALDPSRETPQQARAKAARKRSGQPSEEDLAKMRNASRQRSAASAPAD